MRIDGLIDNRKTRWWITPAGAKSLAVDHPEVAAEVNQWLAEQGGHTPPMCTGGKSAKK